MKHLLLSALLITLAVPVPAQSVFVGTGTTQNAWNGYPAPYGNWYWGARQQMLVPATELTGASMPSGNIIGLGFDVPATQGVALQGVFPGSTNPLGYDLTSGLHLVLGF